MKHVSFLGAGSWGTALSHFVCKQWTSGYDLVKGESRDRYASRSIENIWNVCLV